MEREKLTRSVDVGFGSAAARSLLASRFSFRGMDGEEGRKEGEKKKKERDRL